MVLLRGMIDLLLMLRRFHRPEFDGFVGSHSMLVFYRLKFTIDPIITSAIMATPQTIKKMFDDGITHVRST